MALLDKAGERDRELVGVGEPELEPEFLRGRLSGTIDDCCHPISSLGSDKCKASRVRSRALVRLDPDALTSLPSTSTMVDSCATSPPTPPPDRIGDGTRPSFSSTPCARISSSILGNVDRTQRPTLLMAAFAVGSHVNIWNTCIMSSYNSCVTFTPANVALCASRVFSSRSTSESPD